MLTYLNVVIGLSFVCLLFSLLVSTVNEFIRSLVDTRSKFLREGLKQLLGNSDAHVDQLLKHGLIDALSRQSATSPKARGPAYIDARSFALALLDQVSPLKPGATRTTEDMVTGLQELKAKNEALAQSLTALFEAAAKDLTVFREGIESWFDTSMTRVSAWYKRYTQYWLFGIGLVVAAVWNVDAIRLAQALARDPKLQASIVELATKTANAGLETSGPKSLPANPDTTKEPEAARQDFREKAKAIALASADLQASGLPLGWSGTKWSDVPEIVAESLGGWLIMGVAATLGAQFWFDLLGRLVNLRANGARPDEAARRR